MAVSTAAAVVTMLPATDGALSRRWSAAVQSAVALWSIVMVGYTFATGVRHDYAWYVEQWQLVLNDQDPWSTVADNGNAYGPIHTLLAYSTPMHVLAPKLVMAGMFLITNFLLVRALLRRYPTPSPNALGLYVLLIPLNALIVVSVFKWGDNDALVAALIGLACLARFRARLAWAGVLLGCAVLLKYYPAILIPFFCLDVRRVKWTPLVTALATTAIGLALTWARWGDAFLQAVRFGADRRPSLMSVFVYVEARMSDSWLVRLIEFNSLLIVVVLAATLVAAYGLRMSWIQGSAIGLLSVLFFYKIGHTQFYVPWVVLLVGLLVSGTPRSRALLYACMPLVVYLSAYQALFSWYWDEGNLFPDGAFLFEKSWIPAFSLTVLTLVASYLVIARGSIDSDEPEFIPHTEPVASARS